MRKIISYQETSSKFQETKKFQTSNNQNANIRIFDLEERTLKFSKLVLGFLQTIPKNQSNFKLTDQLIRSATSVGANYIEANDSLGKKDFLMRLKVSRKEAKETLYWLNLLLEVNQNLSDKILLLIKEAHELKNILSKIIINSQ
jgi:four helix bundle protein